MFTIALTDDPHMLRLDASEHVARFIRGLPSLEADVWDLERDEWKRRRLDETFVVDSNDAHDLLIRCAGVGRCLGLEEALSAAHEDM